MQSRTLTPRWKQLRPHDVQSKLWQSTARFNLVEASRRSGKTELAKRAGVLAAMEGRLPDFRVIFAAPTRDHAKDLYWEDLKALIPSRLIRGDPLETELRINLVHGPHLKVVGMDEPRRIEGKPIDWGFFDEMAEMREGVFDRHIRPALATDGREGRAWFFGVPRIGHVPGGGKEFKKLADIARSGKDPDFAYFTWPADGIVAQGEIDAARATMDPIIFAQEFLAKRVSFGANAYYNFDRELHARRDEKLKYDQRAPLVFCFDFNVEPGVALVLQEQRFRERPSERTDRPEVDDLIVGAIGEVWIEKCSNTPTVCRKLIADWGKHQGDVLCYGDPAGGARTTKLDGDGTDWTIIREYLRPVFGERLSVRGPGTEPAQRPRINALNAMLKNAAGKVRHLIDVERCPRYAEGLEETQVKPGSDGELWKPPGDMVTHLPDAGGYFFVRAYPITGGSRSSSVAII